MRPGSPSDARRLHWLVRELDAERRKRNLSVAELAVLASGRRPLGARRLQRFFRGVQCDLTLPELDEVAAALDLELELVNAKGK